MKLAKRWRLDGLGRGQQGLSVIELLLVLGLTGLIGAVATMSISQLFITAPISNDQNTAINQVRNAGHWISRDVQMAKAVDDSPGGSALLQLTVDNWDASQTYTVVYSLVDSSDGLRELWRDRGGQQTLVAQYIKPRETGVTDCQWDGEVLTVTITAQVGDKVETRVLEAKPRPDQPA